MFTAKVEYTDGAFKVLLLKDGFYTEQEHTCQDAKEVYMYMYENKVVSFDILTPETGKRMVEMM